MLLELDVDIDATDQKKSTALHHAAMRATSTPGKAPAGVDADVDATDENGSRPRCRPLGRWVPEVRRISVRFGAFAERLGPR